MAKGSNNKLTKFKSVLKKMQSFKLGGSGRTAAPALAVSDGGDAVNDHRLHPVYVGKSRRRYLVTSEVIENPLFRELVTTEDNDYGDGTIIVNCEVVMFEHMLWMMENSNDDDDDDPHQPESLDELVQYYAC